MEFEDVNEKVAWEARRVAAAFEVEEWRRVFPRNAPEWAAPFSFIARQKGLQFEWSQRPDFGVCFLAIAKEESRDACLVGLDEGVLVSSDTPELNELMVRSLYRLGLEDDCTHEESILVGINRELNCELSYHEKLELRLSMPREFWPQKWLDEEQV